MNLAKPKASEQTEAPSRKKQEETAATTPIVPPARIAPNNRTGTGAHDDAHEEKNYRLSRRQFWVALVTLVVLALYTAIAAYQAYKMREATKAAQESADNGRQQTDLFRQQLIGTEAAVIVADFGGFEPNKYAFNIGFRNDGRVIGSKVSVRLAARRETVSGAMPIGEPWSCDFDLPPVVPGKVSGHQCFLAGLNGDAWQPIANFKQTIAVDGSFSYWNGFEDARQTICLRYVPSGLRSRFGSEGPGSFVSCDWYPAWIEYLRERMAGSDAGSQPPPR